MRCNLGQSNSLLVDDYVLFRKASDKKLNQLVIPLRLRPIAYNELHANLMVSDLRSEAKGSRFESGC